MNKEHENQDVKNHDGKTVTIKAEPFEVIRNETDSAEIMTLNDAILDAFMNYYTASSSCDEYVTYILDKVGRTPADWPSPTSNFVYKTDSKIENTYEHYENDKNSLGNSLPSGERMLARSEAPGVGSAGGSGKVAPPKNRDVAVEELVDSIKGKMKSELL